MRSDDFRCAVNFVLLEEGGLVADPRGGLTKFGISQHAFPTLDVGQLSREDAVEIYEREYWQAAHCDRFPWPLSLALFDGAVQHGVGTAVILLQRALRVLPDGIVGPETLGAARSAPTEDVLVDYLARRGEYYAGITDGPLLSWFRRLMRLALETQRPLT